MLTLVADDHEIVREGLVALLELNDRDDPFQVMQGASYGDALLLARRNRFALAIVDLYMPDADGLEGLKKLIALMPAAPVIVLSGSEDPEDARDVLEAGASGYIPKAVGSAVILSAVEHVLGGGIYQPKSTQGPGERAASQGPGLPGTDALTTRQLEVLEMMSAGESNKGIARALGVSPETVKTHVSAILAATSSANRAEAAAQAKNVLRQARGGMPPRQ